MIASEADLLPRAQGGARDLIEGTGRKDAKIGRHVGKLLLLLVDPNRPERLLRVPRAMPGPANGDHQVVGCGPRDGLRIPLDRPEHRERGSGVVRGDKDAMARQGRNERLRCRRQAGAKERETGRQRRRGGPACHREELRRETQTGEIAFHIRVSRTVTENGSAGLEDEFEEQRRPTPAEGSRGGSGTAQPGGYAPPAPRTGPQTPRPG